MRSIIQGLGGVVAFALCLGPSAAEAVVQAPPAPYYMWGAVPCEFCSYGARRALGVLPIWQLPDGNSLRSDSIMPGEEFTPITGVLVTHSAPYFVVEESIINMKTGIPIVTPGDTVWVLAYLGEGVGMLWSRGSEWWYDYPFEVVEEKGEPETEWWGLIVDERRQRGWVLLNRSSCALAPRNECPQPAG